jgi:hypothetical protein
MYPSETGPGTSHLQAARSSGTFPGGGGRNRRLGLPGLLIALLLSCIAVEAESLTPLSSASATVQVTVQPPLLPNVLFPRLIYQLDPPVVVTTARDSMVDSGTLPSETTLYVNFVSDNVGDAIVTTPWTAAIFIDQVLISTVAMPYDVFATGLAFGGHSVGPLTPGSHTVQVVLNSSGSFLESNLADNVYSKTILVAPGISTASRQSIVKDLRVSPRLAA